tara:strand:- start:20333 stop:21976 length:1644 start_codon:yes stop_codon:yes gene_type:complete
MTEETHDAQLAQEQEAERRATLKHTEQFLNNGATGGRTSAGVSVSNQSAFQFTAIYAAIRVLAESIASLPLITYERLPGGGKRRATETPSYTMLHDAPSPEQTACSMIETVMAHVLSWGNGYCELVRDGAGNVREMYPIRPDRVKIYRLDGQLIYCYRTDHDGDIILPYQNVLHIAGLGFDGLQGYSPIHQARTAIGLGKAAEEFGSAFFGNAARPSGVLSHPGHLTPEAMERLRESWSSLHQGPRSTGRVVIAEEGLSWSSIGIPPEDAQFLQTRRFQIEEIARVYRVSPLHLQDLSRATYSNFEQAMLSFYVDTLRPWLVKWEQELKRKVFGLQSNFFAEFQLDGLLRGDTISRYQAYKVGREAGFLSVNEIRSLENMNPVEGGDRYIEPLNYQAVGEPDTDVVDSPGTEDRTREVFNSVLSDATSRMMRVESQAIKRALNKHDGQPADFVEWLAEFRVKHKRVVLSTFTPIVDSVAAYKGIEPTNMRSLLERFIDDSDNQFAKTIQTLLQTNQDSTETRSAIVELLDEYDAETVTEHMMNSLEI